MTMPEEHERFESKRLDDLLASLGPVGGVDWARLAQQISDRLEAARPYDSEARLDRLLEAVGEDLPVHWDGLSKRIAQRVTACPPRSVRRRTLRIFVPLAAAASIALAALVWYGTSDSPRPISAGQARGHVEVAVGPSLADQVSVQVEMPRDAATISGQGPTGPIIVVAGGGEPSPADVQGAGDEPAWVF